MGKYSVILTDTAKEDLKIIHKSGNKVVIKKIEKLFVELSEHPQTGTGKPERLKGEGGNVYSRRITQKDRLVYEVHDTIISVYVLSVEGHYGDK